jgi:Phosphotransferase enzyme family
MKWVRHTILLTRKIGPQYREFKCYIQVIRKWKTPWGGSRICSLPGTSVRSVRIPNHSAGPLESEEEFNEHLIKPAWSGGFSSELEYENAIDQVKMLHKLSHQIVFTHGDLQHHNILVQGGRITGFPDWESAGWYPDYWEYTTTLRFTIKDFWWYDIVMGLGADKYLMELECEYALTSLTSASYYW